MKQMNLMLARLAAAALALAGGCCVPRPRSTAPRPPATAPAPATQPSHVYDSASAGIKIAEPAGYAVKPSTDVDLLLVPAGQPAVPTDSLSLEIPDLPVHIPGLIPLNMVVNGYVKDMKKSHPGVTFQKNQAYTSPNAKAWIVQSQWTAGHTTAGETAILIVHGDHVFILRANADAAGRAKTLKDYDAFVKSMQWTK